MRSTNIRGIKALCIEKSTKLILLSRNRIYSPPVGHLLVIIDIPDRIVFIDSTRTMDVMIERFNTKDITKLIKDWMEEKENESIICCICFEQVSCYKCDQCSFRICEKGVCSVKLANIEFKKTGRFGMTCPVCKEYWPAENVIVEK
jgi:hypothetical protein